MTPKIKKAIYIILILIPCSILIMSSAMKLMGSTQIVDGLTKSGLGKLVTVIGIIELVSVILFIYPKTFKVGFLLLCSYLGGAMCIELAGGQPPASALFLALLWISVFIRDKNMFLKNKES